MEIFANHVTTPQYASGLAVLALQPDGSLDPEVLDALEQMAGWIAVHGDTLHNRVGKTAHRIAFAARWMPRCKSINAKHTSTHWWCRQNC